MSRPPAVREIDLRGLRCPLPVLKTRRALAMAALEAEIVVIADDPLSVVDIPNFVRESGDRLVAADRLDDAWRFTIRRGDGGAAASKIAD